MGLVNRVVPAAELMDEAARKLAAHPHGEGAPGACGSAMEAVHGGLEMDLDDALNWEAHLFGLCRGHGRT